MTPLSISRAWQETLTIVRRDGSILFPVAFALMALPSIAFRFFAPIDPFAEAIQPVPTGPWVLWAFPVLLLTMLGALAVTMLALRSGVSVGEALGVSARRIWVLVATSLLIGLAAALVTLPIAVLATLLGGKAANGITLFVLGLIALVVSVRLTLLYPVTVAEPVGPVTALRRSWSLTKGHFWQLLGFLLLALVVAAIVSIAVSMVGGVLVNLATGGPPEHGSVGGLVLLLIGGILNAVISVFLLVMLARVYAALVGEGRRSAFD